MLIYLMFFLNIFYYEVIEIPKVRDREAKVETKTEKIKREIIFIKIVKDIWREVVREK